MFHNRLWNSWRLYNRSPVSCPCLSGNRLFRFRFPFLRMKFCPSSLYFWRGQVSPDTQHGRLIYGITTLNGIAINSASIFFLQMHFIASFFSSISYCCQLNFSIERSISIQMFEISCLRCMPISSDCIQPRFSLMMFAAMTALSPILWLSLIFRPYPHGWHQCVDGECHFGNPGVELLCIESSWGWYALKKLSWSYQRDLWNQIRGWTHLTNVTNRQLSIPGFLPRMGKFRFLSRSCQAVCPYWFSQHIFLNKHHSPIHCFRRNIIWKEIGFYYIRFLFVDGISYGIRSMWYGRGLCYHNG